MIKKTILITITLIILAIITSCASKQPVLVCQEPYIRAYNGVSDFCCLDADNNRICDSTRPDAGNNPKTFYKDSKQDLGQQLENISRQKWLEHELEDEYNVKKAVWDRQKKEEQHEEEVLDEFE